MLGQSLLYENNIHKDFIATVKEFQYLKGFGSIKIVRFCSHEPMYVNIFLLVMLTFSPAEN